MKKLILERELDKVGRITIPVGIRIALNIKEADSLECYMDKEKYIVLRKVENHKDGVTRRVDSLGRYSIPAELRDSNNTNYQVFLDREDELMLLKLAKSTNGDTIRQMSNEELARYLYTEQECAAWKNEKEVLNWLNEKNEIRR